MTTMTMTMKKMLAAAALSACGAAQADVGPLYITYPGYCNVKQIYVNPYNDVYGREVGCTASIGSPFFGTIDSASGNVYVSTQDNGVCLTAYRADGWIKGGCSNGVTYSYGVPVPYVVSAFAPRASKVPGGKDLPSIGH